MNATMSVILGDTYNKVRAILAFVNCVHTVDARSDAKRQRVHYFYVVPGTPTRFQNGGCGSAVWDAMVVEL